MLRLNKLSVRLGQFRLSPLDLEVAKGEYFVLLGPSGSGKTVLLEILAGLLGPDTGNIELEGVDITREKISRRRVGLVYQDRALFPHLSVFENVAYGLRCLGEPETAIQARVRELAENCGFSDLLERSPRNLSAGESQRVALARSVAARPRLLLLDEPLASLDCHARVGFRSLLRRLNRDGLTLLHVTHDFEEALAQGDRVGILDSGALVQVGAPERVFRHPATEFVARFVGIRNVIRGRVRVLPGEEFGLFQGNEGGATFRLVPAPGPGPGCFILRPEDGTLHAGATPSSSARNLFPARVTDLEEGPTGVFVSLDLPPTLVVHVSQEARKQLKIERGASLSLAFKASAAGFIPKKE